MKTSALDTLEGKGHRLTRVRSTLVGHLENHHGPFSAQELLTTLKQKGIRANKTTIYRELDFLMRHTLVREVNLGERQARYELNSHDHHHHLVCVKCRTVDAVDLAEDLDTHEQRIKKTKGFAVSRHALEFFGLCLNCQQRN